MRIFQWIETASNVPWPVVLCVFVVVVDIAAVELIAENVDASNYSVFICFSIIILRYAFGPEFLKMLKLFAVSLRSDSGDGWFKLIPFNLM